jgi:hypothetical protein
MGRSQRRESESLVVLVSVGKARPGRSGANASDDQALIGSVVSAIWAIDVGG